jgi:hypothetical protein
MDKVQNNSSKQCVTHLPGSFNLMYCFLLCVYVVFVFSYCIVTSCLFCLLVFFPLLMFIFIAKTISHFQIVIPFCSPIIHAQGLLLQLRVLHNFPIFIICFRQLQNTLSF